MILSARTFATLLVSLVVIAVCALIAQLPAAALTPLVYVLTVTSWISAGVLGRAAWIKPRIGALTERTFIAVIIAVLGTVSAVLVYNTDHGRILFAIEVSALVFRLAILAILAVPSIWLIVWIRGGLGEGK